MKQIAVSLLAVGLVLGFVIPSLASNDNSMDTGPSVSNDNSMDIVPVSNDRTNSMDGIVISKIVEIQCMPIEVMVFNGGISSRVHVLCANSYDGIKYFALPTSNSGVASSFTDIATEVLARDYINIQYDKYDTRTGPLFGCAAADCRPVITASIKRQPIDMSNDVALNPVSE